ncbi:MAG: DNA polymerase III subunit delta [Thiohalophilus sp.]
MKLRAEQLPAHLQKGLAPVYLLSGDEPFQLDQAVGAIRRQAQQQGHTDRQVLHADARFDWHSLGASAANLSLFAEKQLIELRLPTGKPGAEGSKALLAYLDNPPADTVLLIISARLDKQQQNSKWYRAIERAGVSVAIWPIEAAQLPAWLKQRMALRDMQPSEAALQMLVDRVEGNLLAADQELEKLRLLSGGGTIDAEQVAAAVADSARYDLFSLVDVTLSGDLGRAQRMLFGLRAEGVEAILVLWALSREIRTLAAMAAALETGRPVAAVLQQHRVWDKRKAPVGAALRRYPRAADWQALLRHCRHIDFCIKGQAAGAEWEELLQLTAALAGTPLFEPGRASG